MHSLVRGRFRRLFVVLSITQFLAGCASNQFAATMARENAAGIRNAAPCCKSIAEAFGGAPDLESTTIVFDKESRHHDFGQGLAPFAAYRLPAGAKVIETQAPLELVGWAYGGDGTPRYVDVQVRFFDDRHGPLPRQVLESDAEVRRASGR